MTLTPEDVQAVRFRTSRMRAGYRMADVDAFLDQVAATIEELGEQVTIALLAMAPRIPGDGIAG